MVIDIPTNQRVLTIESLKRNVRNDLQRLHERFLDTFSPRSGIWGEAESVQRDILEGFRKDQRTLRNWLVGLEIDRLLVLSDDPGFVVDALGLAGPCPLRASGRRIRINGPWSMRSPTTTGPTRPTI